jgi:LmbE family N-acetylglucosaminyl deacetylase
VLVPLGLFHSDHELVHRASRALARRPAGPRLLWYEDAIYRRLPGLVRRRLAEMARWSLDLRRVPPARRGGASSQKARAVAAYRSQLRALATEGRPGAADALEEEGLWTLDR